MRNEFTRFYDPFERSWPGEPAPPESAHARGLRRILRKRLERVLLLLDTISEDSEIGRYNALLLLRALEDSQGTFRQLLDALGMIEDEGARDEDARQEHEPGEHEREKRDRDGWDPAA